MTPDQEAITYITDYARNGKRWKWKEAKSKWAALSREARDIINTAPIEDRRYSDFTAET